MTTKQLIKEYVDDHFNTFGFYPYDVEVDGQVYSYENYWLSQSPVTGLQLQ